jgi:glyoxylate reductase
LLGVSDELPLACVAITLPYDVEQGLAHVCRLRQAPVGASRSEILSALADAEGLLCSALFPVNAELMAAAPRLRVISNFGVGFNNVDLAEATRRGIAVCNTPKVLSEAVADLTMSLILAASRNLLANAEFARDGGWSARATPPPLGFDVEGKTLGILGFGRIGREVARRARAFRMRVLYHDIELPLGAEWNFCAYRQLDHLLLESDIVSVHVNLTAQTHQMIGQGELGLMQRSAWLINTSRGAVIDQAALVTALKQGRIAGAALDVLETEPPAADDPLLSLPNVILLPHVGSATVETREAMLELAVRNLSAVLQGRRPSECVNPEALAQAIKRRD